jgi:hypothetical protein
MSIEYYECLGSEHAQNRKRDRPRDELQESRNSSLCFPPPYRQHKSLNHQYCISYSFAVIQFDVCTLTSVQVTRLVSQLEHTQICVRGEFSLLLRPLPSLLWPMSNSQSRLREQVCLVGQHLLLPGWILGMHPPFPISLLTNCSFIPGRTPLHNSSIVSLQQHLVQGTPYPSPSLLALEENPQMHSKCIS